jgi:hypothetical protein
MHPGDGKSLNLKQPLGAECCFADSHYSYPQDVRSGFDLGTKNNLSRNGPAARNRSMYEIASTTSMSFSFVDYPALGQAKINTKVPCAGGGRAKSAQ